MIKPDFVGHQIFDLHDIHVDAPPPVNNIIVDTGKEGDTWIKDSTSKLGYWRAYFRSTYIRWALVINGLHVAKDRYEKKIGEHVVFKISSIRRNDVVPIAAWDMDKTSFHYKETIPLMASWGIIDLYSCLEEFVFDFYSIYLNHKPDTLIKGKEFAELRKL